MSSVKELEVKVAELTGLLRVAEHKLHCAQISIDHGDRILGELYQMHERLIQDRDRIWTDLVPADVKQRLEDEELERKKRNKAATEELMRKLGAR